MCRLTDRVEEKSHLNYDRILIEFTQHISLNSHFVPVSFLNRTFKTEVKIKVPLTCIILNKVFEQ